MPVRYIKTNKTEDVPLSFLEKSSQKSLWIYLHLLPIKTPTCRRFIRRNAFRLWAFSMSKGVKLECAYLYDL
jgi:hypothetical protein